MREISNNCACVCLAYLFQLMEAHTSRDKAIKGCIIETSEVVGRLREARAKDSDNFSIIKQLRKEQNKVVPLFSEMGHAICLSRIGTRLLMYSGIINVSWGWCYMLRICRLCIMYPLMICTYPCQLCTCLLRLCNYLPRLRTLRGYQGCLFICQSFQSFSAEVAYKVVYVTMVR